jgi:hypothetical protein
MTQDDVIEMARQAGIGWGEGIGGMTDFLEAFAKLVAAKEREACAQICLNAAFHRQKFIAGGLACCEAIRAIDEALEDK